MNVNFVWRIKKESAVRKQSHKLLDLMKFNAYPEHFPVNKLQNNVLWLRVWYVYFLQSRIFANFSHYELYHRSFLLFRMLSIKFATTEVNSDSVT
jgi:low temperature requirement protein LtrA